MNVICPECGNQGVLSPQNWRCKCGAAWEPQGNLVFDPHLIEKEENTIWRYRRLYGVDFEQPTVRLGAGWTPLLPLMFQDRKVAFKLEYFSPTGSFKDRGTEMMINILANQGVSHVIDDSSGNAGAAVAAYSANAGMRADIFVPAYASPNKQAQIAIYGANVHPIPGKRVEAKLAALKAAVGDAALASHAYHPGFLLGQQSVAWEVWEQMGGKAPDWYVVPVGQGVHLLGIWLGFRRLLQSGLIDRLPHIIGVQSKRISPLAQAFHKGLNEVPDVEVTQASVAEGLAISQPVRGKRLLEALRESGGDCLVVDEDEILAGQRQIALKGLYIEPTSATVVAALAQVFKMAKPQDTIVAAMTGSGLKGTPHLS